MEVIGTPHSNNNNMKENINNKIVLSKSPLIVDEDYFSSLLSSHFEVLDIGQSLRDEIHFVRTKTKRLDTLDINAYESYPEIQMDLCEKIKLPDTLKYDLIFCFSILEHCYNPFIACRNLFSMLKGNSRIVGSVPFLFPHHCPDDLEYQDYFRFTKHSFVALFPKATKIYLYPMRGRVGAGLNIVSQRYKDIFERKLKRTTSLINSIDQKRRPDQTSGFHFEIFN